MNENKISIGTIVRTIALAVVLLNMFLKSIGKPIIDINENEILVWVEYIIEFAVIVVAFWKNNSYSEAAIKADAFLKSLRANNTIESEEE